MRMKIKYKMKYIILLLILIFSASLRFYRIGGVPSGFYTDEALYGYHAYSLLETWRDLEGEFLPLLIRANKKFFSSVFSYSIIPFIKVFGLNEFSVRAPSALWGVLTVLATFFLCEAFFSDARISILASLFLSVSPFHILHSKAGFEVTSMPFFFVVSLLFLLKARKNARYYIPALIVLGVGMYAHSTAWVFFPLFCLLFFLVYRPRRKETPYVLVSTVLFILISSQAFLGMLSTTLSFSHQSKDLSVEYIN